MIFCSSVFPILLLVLATDWLTPDWSPNKERPTLMTTTTTTTKTLIDLTPGYLYYLNRTRMLREGDHMMHYHVIFTCLTLPRILVWLISSWLLAKILSWIMQFTACGNTPRFLVSLASVHQCASCPLFTPSAFPCQLPRPVIDDAVMSAWTRTS